ncbi:MAG: insulinase family protein [Gammaproteobacteria bacterium]|nr:insulinase family protein [Gammaproteobacteria bacterium]
MLNKKYLLLALIVVIGVIAAVYWFTPLHKSVAPNQGLNIETWQIKNGAKVFYVAAPQLPMVDVRVVFNAGSARDNGKPGLARLTNRLLDHGAGEWSTEQVLERMDNVGAQFSSSAYRDMAVVSLRSLTDKSLLSTAVETMAAVLQQPKFMPVELEHERERTLVALQNQRESPDDLAELAFYSAVYEQHPYASPVLGTPQSVAAISNADVMEFYHRYYVGNNALIVIVGDVDRAKAEQMAEQIVAGLPPGQPVAALPDVPIPHASKLIKEPYPSTQTHIWVGQPGMTRDDKDYFPLYVGNHILGGSGFGSRIVDQIRENKGLAYSSYSYFIPMQRPGPFFMVLQTKNEQAEQALQLLRDILAKFISNGPTEEELAHAKKNITGGFPLRLDSNKDITEQVASIGFYNLPLDYLKTFNAKVEAVTRDQIMDAFRRRIDPQTMVTVMLGGNENAAQNKP